MINHKTESPNRAPHNPIFVILVIIFSIPSIFHFDRFTTSYLFLFLTLIPFFHACFISKKYNIFKPIVLISLVYAIAYPITGLKINEYTDSLSVMVDEYSVDDALRWSYRGFACFIGSYVISEFYLSMKNPNKIKDKGNDIFPTLYVKFCYVLGFLGLLGFLISFVIYQGVPVTFLDRNIQHSNTTVMQIVHYLIMGSYIFFFVYVLFRSRFKKRKLLNWLFYILLLQHVIMIAGEGSKARIFALIICILLPISLSKVKFTMKQGVIGILLAISIFIVFSVITNYRILMRADPLSVNNGVIETIEIQTDNFADAFILSYRQFNAGMFKDGEITNQILTRLGSVPSFAYLLMSTDGKSPYENIISTFLIPLFAVIPRTIFPLKPIYFHSGELASRIFGWEHGGISVTLIGSLYWSWGYYGICLGMTFIGFVFAQIISRFHYYYNKEAGILYAGLLVILMLYLLNPGKTFHAIVMDIIRYYIALYLLINIILRRNTKNILKKQELAIEEN